MPLVKKTEGYPVELAQASTATVEKATEVSRVIKESAVQPSAKDRSIVRQCAGKIAGHAVSNYAGSKEAWLADFKTLTLEIEKFFFEA